MDGENRCPGQGDGSNVQLGGEHREHSATAFGPQVQVIGTSPGLVLSGPGGMVCLSNPTLAAVAEFAIALSDLILPDPDTEANGAEDDFLDHQLSFAGPGCPIADPDFGGEEAGEPEWGV